MLLTLVIGVLFGGAAATLLRQWSEQALVPGHVGSLAECLPSERRTVHSTPVTARGGLVFVPQHGRRAA
jgi:hypothetical protein